MSIRLLTRAVLTTALIALVSPVAAQAQIYAWRDAAGNLVLSDKKKDSSAETYSITTATAIRTTRPSTRRAAQYDPLIEEHSARHRVNADLVRAVIQAESAFNPKARSPKGAMGLMQLMPATAAEFGVIDPYDPAENIRAGVAYLKQLLVSFAGRVELALAAYNAGPQAVKKYGGTVPPYRETRNYVKKVSSTAEAATGTSGLPGPGERTTVYRTVEVVDGREVVRYSGTPRAGAQRVTTADRR